jgi:multidrug transporter EmrE-like cation transporter
MIGYGSAIGLLVAALCGVAASQVIAKWRFTVLGPVWHNASGIAEVAGSALADAYIWLAALLVIIAAVCWYLAMTRLHLSFMLPAAGGVAPVVAVLAHYLFGEPLTVPHLFAIFLIAGGIVLLGWLQQ